MPRLKKKKSKKKAKKKQHKVIDFDEALVVPPLPFENLVELLTTRPLDDRELFGIKIDTNVLQKLTSEEIKDLKFVFDTFDLDKDGFLKGPDVKRALKALQFPTANYEGIILDYAQEPSKGIDLNNFLNVVIDRQGHGRDMRAEFVRGFQLFDHDSSGAIDQNKLRRAANQCKMKLSDRQIELMVEDADLNGDGKVDLEEFISIMRRTNLC